MKKIKYFGAITLVILILAGCAQINDENTESTQNITTIAESETKIISPETPTKLLVDGVETELLGGAYLKVGDKLQDAALIKPTGTFDTMEKTNWQSIEGVKIIHSVPSLDTPVCSLQTRYLDDAVKTGEFPDIDFLTISADTPFALKHFSELNNIDSLTLLSDYQTNEFAKENKLFLPEYLLSTRAIMVVDENNVIQYIEYADEVTEEISVADAINFVRQNYA